MSNVAVNVMDLHIYAHEHLQLSKLYLLFFILHPKYLSLLIFHKILFYYGVGMRCVVSMMMSKQWYFSTCAQYKRAKSFAPTTENPLRFWLMYI